MTDTPDEHALLRFGIFELDPRSGELRREGAPVRLPPQPFKVLWMLASRPGEVVPREEIRQELWGDDTFVDFDGGLNFCINQIRRALRDSAESPRFIHTLPRRGYRFLASVERLPVDPARSSRAALVAPEPGLGPRPVSPVRYALFTGGTKRGGAVEALSVSETDALPGPRPAAPPAPRAQVDLAASRPAEVPSLTDPPALVKAARSPERGAWILALVLVVAALGTGFAVHMNWWSRPEPRFDRVTFRRGTVLDARFAPGGQVVYTATWDGGSPELYSLRPEAPESRQLGNGRIAAVAATGELLVVLNPQKSPAVLARMPAAGGPPREMRDDVTAADWSADGSVLTLVRSEQGLDVLELPAGKPVYRTGSRISHPRLSPDGGQVAFLEHTVPGDDGGQVVTVDRNGQRKVISPGWASAEGLAWHPRTGEVWFTATRMGAEAALHAVSRGGVVRRVVHVPGRLVLHDIAADGRTLLQRSIPRLELRGVFPESAGDRDLSWLDYSGITDIAPDGSLIVFGESGEGGGPGYSVYLRKTDGSPPVRLGEGRPMGLSPDGRWVVSIPLEGARRIVLLPTGAGEARVLPGPGLSGYTYVGWFPDGQRLLLGARNEAGEPRVYVQDLSGGAPRVISGEGQASARLVSPDGRKVLLWRPGRGERPFSLLTLETGHEEPITALSARDRPLEWSPDAASILVGCGAVPLAVERVALATGARESLLELRPSDPAGAGPMAFVAITPDARWYAYSFHRTLSDLYVVDGLR